LVALWFGLKRIVAPFKSFAGNIVSQITHNISSSMLESTLSVYQLGTWKGWEVPPGSSDFPTPWCRGASV